MFNNGLVEEMFNTLDRSNERLTPWLTGDECLTLLVEETFTLTGAMNI